MSYTTTTNEDHTEREKEMAFAILSLRTKSQFGIRPHNAKWCGIVFCLSVCPSVRPSVRMYACLFVCNTITIITFRSSFLVCWNILREYAYGSSSYMKVIGSRSRSQQQKKHETSCELLQCKTLISNDFGSTEDVKLARSLGFSAMTYRMV